MTTAAVPTTPVSPPVKLTARQRVCLAQIARRQTNPQRLVRRATSMLAMDAGANNCRLTRQRRLKRGTVRAWRRRWLALTPTLEQVAAQAGSDQALARVIEDALTDTPRPGAPATLTAEPLGQIVAVACEDPVDAERPISHWTPRAVADEVRKRGSVETMSTRSVGRFFKSGRFEAPSGRGLAQRDTR